MSENYLRREDFLDAAVPPEIRELNAWIVDCLAQVPNWWDVGAPAVREARAQGRGVFPLPPRSERAETRVVESLGRKVPVRIIRPPHAAGVYLHFHGGGWVLGAPDQQDTRLVALADDAGLACVSVDYRLAPEHPYPAGPEDCEAVAAWLARDAKAEFGTDLLTTGGESAGAHLAAVTLLRLRDRHGFRGFRGANLAFGAFDLSMTPSQIQFGDRRLILRTEDLHQFIAAFLPAGQDRRDPDVSPLYADLRGLCPALFTTGTADSLLDDSLFMHARWVAAGNHGQIAVYPGGAHVFTAFPCQMGARALERIVEFLKTAVTGT